MSAQVPNDQLDSPCGTGLGGLNHLRLIHALDCEFLLDPIRWPRYTDYTVKANNLQLKPEAFFGEIYFHPNKGGFSESESPSPHGSLHRQQVNIFIPQDHHHICDWYYKAQNQKFVALLATANDRYRIIGTPDNPASLQLDGNFGTRYSDPNGYILNITASQPHKAFFIEDIDDNIQFAAGNAAFSFDLSLFPS